MIKDVARNVITNYLTWCAQRKLRRWNPVVIGITGTVGKTTTKEMIAHILESHFAVKKSEGGLNSDIGLPLTILNLKTGYNAVSWLTIIVRAFTESFRSEAARYFIAEMGADKPGDIEHLTKIARPHISVVTSVARVHLNEDQFKNEEDIFDEKSKLVSCLGKDDIAILNADNEWTLKMKEKTSANVFLFSRKKDSQVELVESKATLEGITFTIRYEEKEYSFSSPVVADFLAFTFLPAILLGFLLKVPIEKIHEAVQSFRMPNGRFSFIEGINGSWIIDSSYNSSSYASREALSTLAKLPAQRKIAVLGNMNELGKYSEEEHKSIGAFAADKCDLLITVGKDAHWIAQAASDQQLAVSHTVDQSPLERGGDAKRRRGVFVEGMDKIQKKHQVNVTDEFKVKSFMDFQSAADFLKPLIQKDDLILVKGSQNKVFLEELIKQIMRHPEKAPDILVRQGPEWTKKKHDFLASVQA